MPSIDDTVDALAAACADARADGSRTGYFAALYGNVTRQVRDDARRGAFDDGARMEAFVVAFAERYLEAYRAWRADRPTTAAWAVAFDAAGRWRPVVLQHLLLGINAHINLDLGIVAADLAGDTAGLARLRGDFDAVNDVLAGLVDASQAAVGTVSPWLGLLDRFGGRHDEAVVRFSLQVARRQAWEVAERLVELDPPARAAEVARLDLAVARLGRRVLRPGSWPEAGLLLVRLRERASVGEVLDVLEGAARPAA